MTDALKMLPLPVERRVELALRRLSKIYPQVDIAAHIIGDPITVNWEADANFLGAFKGALPGHYRYNHRMFCTSCRTICPRTARPVPRRRRRELDSGWVEGAVQTGLNAVWGVMRHFGGACAADNPGPGDVWPERAPIDLGN